MPVLRFRRRSAWFLALALAVALIAGAPRAEAAPPDRIISLSPTATEMLFATGAGRQVIAVDDQSNYPARAPRTRLSGFRPNIEAIAYYRPNLVVVSNDTNNVVAGLRKLGIRVVVSPAARGFGDVYRQIRQLGGLTGHAPQAKRLVNRMRARVKRIRASLDRPARRLTYYHELDQNYFSATSMTFIGRVYSLLGLRNIADAADDSGSGYPQLNAEYIISADPDLIFLADTKCCDQTPETVAERPGWSGIAAVRNRAVVPLNDDIASRWGPRIVDYLALVARRVAPPQRLAAASQ